MSDLGAIRVDLPTEPRGIGNHGELRRQREASVLYLTAPTDELITILEAFAGAKR